MERNRWIDFLTTWLDLAALGAHSAAPAPGTSGGQGTSVLPLATASLPVAPDLSPAELSITSQGDQAPSTPEARTALFTAPPTTTGHSDQTAATSTSTLSGAAAPATDLYPNPSGHGASPGFQPKAIFGDGDLWDGQPVATSSKPHIDVSGTSARTSSTDEGARQSGPWAYSSGPRPTRCRHRQQERRPWNRWRARRQQAKRPNYFHRRRPW